MRVLVVAMCLVLASCSEPDFFDLDGNPMSLNELNEKTLIVNYWATWCAPCIKEIPELNKLARENVDQVTLVGVNFDRPELAEGLKQAKRMKIEFPVIQGNPAPLLGVEIPVVLPTTYIFSPGGALLTTLVGPQTEETILAAARLKVEG